MVPEGMQAPVMVGNLAARRGYQPDFLELDDGRPVPLPTLTAKRVAARLEDDSLELKYHKFSIVMHKQRRMALFTASNVDWRAALRTVNGRKPTRKQLTGLRDGVAEKWVSDPRISDDHQLPDVFYSKDGGAFDKGHLVRRDDVCWGSSFKDMQKANGDTYRMTNCSPQVAVFNQGARGKDNWGDLETLVQRESKSEKLIVFAGPIFEEDDPIFDGRDQHGPAQIRIPRRYWKIVVAKGASGPEVYGFTLTQDLSAIEFAVPATWMRHMERVSAIEKSLRGLVSLAWLKQRDQFDTVRGRRVHESLAETSHREASMQIQVSLNPHAVAAAEIRAQLDAELHALERPGIQVRADRKAPAAEAFGLAEAYQFIVDCGPGIVALLPLVTAVLQLSNSMLARRGLTSPKAKVRRGARRAVQLEEAGASAPVVVSVNGRQLELPADDRRLKQFLDAVSGPSETRPAHQQR
jgi:DNA/RNA endonuclease G (NUC1)